MDQYIFQAIASFIIGTLLGSFFYTLSLRFSKEDNSIKALKSLCTRSRCPSCGKNINPIALVPVLGYAFLLGRCRECRNKIPLVYPIIEIVYGLLALMVFYRFGFNLYALNMLLLAGLAISISVIDIKTMTIPNSLIIAFVVFSIYPVILDASLKDNIYGLLLMFIFFLVVLLVFPGSFGGGDIKFAAVIGFLLGLEFSIVALEASLITGAISGVAYAIITGKGLKSKIAFGPFLTAGLFVAYAWGRDIIVLYYSWIY